MVIFTISASNHPTAGLVDTEHLSVSGEHYPEVKARFLDRIGKLFPDQAISVTLQTGTLEPNGTHYRPNGIWFGDGIQVLP